jgi:hypothetical protein
VRKIFDRVVDVRRIQFSSTDRWSRSQVDAARQSPTEPAEVQLAASLVTLGRYEEALERRSC